MFDLEDRYWWFVGRRNLALRLLRRYGKAMPDVLDLGCGTGVVARDMAKFANVVALDFSDIALKLSASRNVAHLIQANGESLPLADASFDAIVGLDIFEHIENDRSAYSESLRVLRPGGQLILSVPAFPWLWGPHDVALMHHRRYRRRELIEKLETAGFRVRRCSYSVFLLFPIVVVVRLFEKRRKGPPEASLAPLSRPVNALLIGVQRLEAALVDWIGLPWGSSLVAVAEKPTPK